MKSGKMIWRTLFMARKIRWGILGCGTIAADFAEDIVLTKNCEVLAAGSRTSQKAKAFAKKFGIKRWYGSYQQLLSDGDIDIVYVATPHTLHMQNTLDSIRAGKAVLCEKPIAINAKQFRRMQRAAKKKGVFLMEGMWTRFFPSMYLLRKWLKQKLIGDVLELKADFGVHFRVGPKHRIHNPKLGGGALLDLGIYVVSMASMVFGRQPKKIVSLVHKEKTGVDDQSSIVFQYDNGRGASLSCSGRFWMKQQLCIYGTKGMIIIPDDFYCHSKVMLELEGKKKKVYDFTYRGNGFQYEAEHVANCLNSKKTESDIMGLDESGAIMETMDKIRRQWKLKYTDEK